MVIVRTITILFTFIELLINAIYLLICGIIVAIISLHVINFRIKYKANYIRH